MASPSGTDAPTRDLFELGGELGELIRRHDWASTPIGPPESWPQSLKTAVGIMLAARQPIWIGWGSDLLYLYNDSYTSIIGGKHPWALGRPTREVWREIWNEIGPMLATALRGEQGTYVESQLLIMERNGYPEETYYTFSYNPIPAEDGSVGGIICANTDDTRRVIGERQLGLLRELAASTADVRVVDEACARVSHALAANPRDLPFALLYLGTPDGSLRLAGSSGIAAGHPLVPARIAANAAAPWPVQRALARGSAPVTVPLDAGAGMPSGPWTRPPAQAAVVPIPAAGESGVAGVLVVGLNPFRLFDHDYRNFLELAAGQIALALSTAQAYEDERHRAETLAELDRAKTQFFSNISHEFRTPLTLMLGPLEDALHDAPEGSAQRERIEVALANSRRLLKLVNALLDFTRVEAGRAQARFQPVDLAALTAELASTFRSAMERGGLRYRVDCAPLPAPVHVDPRMWETIVLNLVSNAFKFTLAGEVEVRLACSADGGAAVLTVRDTGTGIPAAQLAHVFERFHRVEGQQGRSFEGSGIGLALVQELVRQHAGTVAVDSVEGEGTTFTVTIPLGAARAGDAAPQQSIGVSNAHAYVDEALRWLPEHDQALPHDDAPAAGLDGACIVLADDNADMRHYVARLLGRSVRVVAVPDGRAALAALRSGRPDLLLTDVMMPGLDGFGLLREVRSDPALHDLPVIMLSARAGEEARIEGLAAGADDYLIKPFSGRELVARVQSNLRLGRERQRAMAALREQTRRLEALNRTAAALAGELDLERLVQTVTDAGVELTGAQFGAFFYNVVDDAGESYTLYTLSGVPREAFSRFPMPRNTAVFAPTFTGESIVRSDDITRDPRYGRNAPYRGMPEGHLPVRSYLAVPVKTGTGEVIGGLFFGHPQAARFNAGHEALMFGIAGQASVAFQNARLFRTAQREIEQRRRAEAELGALNARLEERVEAEVERRSQAEDALRQAQKMEALGKLTGGVAHDFNNLLHVISMNLQLLAREIAGRPQAEQRVESARASVAKGAKLASQLLAFSRRQPLEPKVVDVRRFVSGLDDMLRRALGAEVEIETVIAGGLWNTFVDPGQLENALLNLAINARDAMNGLGKLTIEVGNAHLDHDYAQRHADVQPGQYVLLSVTDTGSGIPAAIIDKVFEPFFSTKPEGRGTGLGLSQVYGFAKQSGGHVKLYSEVGQGTSVKLYLPRSKQAPAAVVDHEAAPAVGGTETVLVVEDDDSVRSTVVELLSGLGYRVLKASDAASAMAIVDSGIAIDVLFTDVVMPGAMRSTELARLAQLRLPGLAVLFTSGYTENAIVHAGRLDDGVELISKPYTREALARRIRHVLATARAGGAPGPAGVAVQPRPAQLRVLLVEDDAAVRVSTAEMLELLGCPTTAVDGVQRALQALDDAVFDVLLADVTLGDGDGHQLAAAALARHPQLAVIFATGRDVDRIPTPAGVAEPLVLRKPYDTRALAAVLQRVGRRNG